MFSPNKNFCVSHDQKWYQLATILSTPFALPMIIVGKQLALLYGAGTAICSILVGNLILWLIASSVISMATEDQSNAIGNVKSYLGNYGAVFMWLVLIISILNWFVHQITATVPSIGQFYGVIDKEGLIKLGVGIGFVTTLLSTGGIRFLKWVTLVSFPLLLFYYLYSIFHSNYSIREIDHFGFSISGIISAIIVLLPGMVNLPTLYRHARSKEDACFGLSIMIILMSFYEISTIWMNFTSDWNVVYDRASPFFSTATMIFIVLTLVYINLINIYFASACWETYIPRFEGAKGCVMIGLMGIIAYTFIQIGTPILYVADLTNCYIGNLGIVLMIAFMVRKIIRHRPRPFEKTLNNVAWVSGCIVSTILVLKNIDALTFPLLMGVSASALVFLIIVFIEEVVWSAKIIFSK